MGQIRNPILYPIELRALMKGKSTLTIRAQPIRQSGLSRHRKDNSAV